jgi:hypothetical protein
MAKWGRGAVDRDRATLPFPDFALVAFCYDSRLRVQYLWLWQ